MWQPEMDLLPVQDIAWRQTLARFHLMHLSAPHYL